MAGLKEQFKTDSKTKPRRKFRSRINGRDVLTVGKKEPGYVYRIVNDEGGKVEQRKEIGYEVVLDKDVTIGDRRVATPTAEGSAATMHVGSGLKGVVMRIKEEYYNEDAAAKRQYIDEVESSLHRQGTAGDYGKVEVGRKE